MSQLAAALAWMVVVASSGAAVAGETRTLQVGDATPDLVFVDIENKPVEAAAYRGWVHVLTFGDRDSSEQMKTWMGDAQIRATRAHPELPVAYLTFADLASVPGFLRGMVRPVLRRTFEKSNEDLAASYRKAGVEPSPDKVAFRFIPDWDGVYLEAFGLENAATYHCWIAVDGRVVAAFDPTTPDVADRYVEAFDRLAPAAAPAEGTP